jgi:hypothetical protein
MRKLIAGMKISVDGKIEGPEGTADWVEAWSEDYGLMSQIDACVLGGGMYPGYEQYWTAIRNDPDKPVWTAGSAPTPAEIEWARFAAQTPHYVLSSTVTSARWPNTSFVSGSDEIAASSSSAARTFISAASRWACKPDLRNRLKEQTASSPSSGGNGKHCG